MQNSEARPARGRCGRITWCVIWVVISLLVIAAAIAVTIVLATFGSGYSIGAAAVLIFLAILFIVVPAIASGIVCCYRGGRYEARVVWTVVVCSLATVFGLAPFFHVIAAVLAIAEITVGEGEDHASVLSLAVLATILNIIASVSSIFLCTASSFYVWGQRPGAPAERKKLVTKKEESKFTEEEVEEKEMEEIEKTAS